MAMASAPFTQQQKPPSQRRPESSPSPPISPLNLGGGDSYIASPLDPIIEHVVADHSTRSQHERSSSIASISFRAPARAGAPSPTGQPRAKTSRIRGASPPPPSRFQHHVSFDNFAAAEPTKNNSISYCLNVKHTGYQYKRRSRTFMVGLDENDYSSIALQWVLEELVDDGDEIVCLRVIEKTTKINNSSETKRFQKEANDLMDKIQTKNDVNRAISIVLEFAFGKVSQTFLQMIQTYEPAMLIVGTKGRSLGGVQGLVSQRNSFSKWCLQYSPIPVVVVRPPEKRIKKKNKREADPARQDYSRILRDSGIQQHETDNSTNHVYFETSNTPAGEAHAVAAALGLPAAFDPTIKPLNLPGSHQLKKVDSGNSEVTSKSSISPDSRPNSPSAVMKSPKSAQLDSPSMSGDESSEEGDEEGEFEVTSGQSLLENENDVGLGPQLDVVQKKLKLHDMEVGEAKALLAPGSRKDSVSSAGSSSRVQDDEDEEA